MADERIEDITGGELTAPAAGDLMVILDASDTTDDAQGTAKYVDVTSLGFLEYATASPTTGNVTGLVGTLHDVDISGITAQRNFLLPTTAAVGDLCGVRISATHATKGRELGLRTGAASDTINGTDYSASDWSKIWQVSEIVVFRCVVANTAWITEVDGRIPCACIMDLTTDASGESAATWTVPTAASAAWTVRGTDYGAISDASNSKFVARRAGHYFYCVTGTPVNTMSTGETFGVRWHDGTNPVHTILTKLGQDTSSVATTVFHSDPLADGDERIVEYFTTAGSDGLDADSGTGPRTTMQMYEILRR